MSPDARQGWRDTLVALALYFTLMALCDAAPAATPTTQEKPTMRTAHSEGPYSATVASSTGYTIVRDRDGQMIGASVSGIGDQAQVPRATVESNGRLFAASAGLYTALTAYMAAVEAACMEGFTPEIVERIEQARKEAAAAFAIMEGTPS